MRGCFCGAQKCKHTRTRGRGHETESSQGVWYVLALVTSPCKEGVVVLFMVSSRLPPALLTLSKNTCFISINDLNDLRLFLTKCQTADLKDFTAATAWEEGHRKYSSLYPVIPHDLPLILVLIKLGLIQDFRRKSCCFFLIDSCFCAGFICVGFI